ncbi:MAG: hypothetical protein SFX74_00175 [Fimbriimonadaceae bacterium]|nr:hypothetical protein [Fimbriimonadaceae bacterium]
MVGILALSTMAAANVGSPATSVVPQNIRFVENKGQWDSAATFRLEAPGQNLWVTKSGVVMDFHRLQRTELAQLAGAENPATRRTGHVVKVDFVGASNAVQPVGIGKGTALRNWILSGKTIEGVREFSEARLVNVVPGVTARYYIDGGAVRYDAILAAGTNPNAVVLNYEGANNLRVGSDGTLMYDTILGTVKEQRLFVYQDMNGVRQPVEAAFRLAGKNRVGFTLGRYDASKPVTIDPQIMAAWTYLPGSSLDRPGSIDRHNGDLIIAGRTQSSAFPTTTGAYDTTISGTNDYFVTRLRQSLTTNALVFSTFIGGAGTEQESTLTNNFANAIAKVYPNGDVLFAGSTSSDLDTPGGFDTVRTSNDGYLARLNGSLGTLKNATFFGGNQGDNIHDIDINPQSGDVAIGLVCRSSDMNAGGYVVGGSAVATKPGTGATDDAFVAVMNQNLNTVKMGTYFGGTGVERVWGVAYGRDYQTVLMAGGTASTNLSPNFGSVGSVSTGYVARYRLGNGTQNAARLALHTFGGGSNEVNATDLVVDMPNDRPIVVGYARGAWASANFSTLAAGAPGFDQSFSATTQARAFVMRFAPELNRITGWTYLEGTGSATSEVARGVAVQSNGTIHISGRTSSADYPLVGTQATNITDTRSLGNQRSFVTRVSNGFAHIGSSVFGTGLAPASNEAAAIVLDGPYNDLFIAGTTTEGINPPTIAGFTPYLSSTSGNGDAYVARIAFFTDPVLIESSASTVAAGQPVSVRLTLNAPVVTAQNITFTVSNPALRLPGGASSVTVTVPAGQRRGSVQLLAQSVASPTPVTVSAVSSGTTLTSPITVNP